jgi:uncharacterized repeat protein (TIGR02543 family)
MGTKTGSISGVYQWPASLGISLGTGEYPSGTITFKDKPSWKENNGKTGTFTLYLCDSSGNNRVALSPTLYIYGSSRVYTTDFTIGSGGTALAGKQIYLTVARDGAIISNGFAHQNASTVTMQTANQTWTLTTTVSPSGYGSVTAGGAMSYNSTKSLTATPSTGRHFSSWSKTAGTLSSTTSNPTTFTMGTSAATVTANFGTNSYTLTVAKGTGISSVSGGGSKSYGSSNNISATASTGYTFKNWTSNNGGTFGNANSASTTFTMPAGNVTVTANAKINSYTLTTAVSPSGGGSVTAGGSMNYGSTKSLTATASTGYAFSSWSKNAGTLSSTTTNPTTFTMGAGNATVTANFTHVQRTLTLAVSPSGGGTTSGGGTKYYNDKVTISATAATGYSFKNWTTSSGGTIANANSASTTYTMPNANATVTANFTHIQRTLTLSVSPSGGGTVSGGGTKYYNDKCSISATASTGYTFKNWTTSSGGTLANANAASTTYTMPNGNATVTANFTINSYTLTTAVSPTGGGTVTAGGSMNYNSQKQLTATASSGYSFSSWSKTAGTLSSTTANPTTFTIGAGNATVTANFTKNNYTLTTTVSPTGGGTVTAGDTIQYTSTKELTATPATGYAFANWTNTSGTLSSTTTNPTTFTMGAGNATVTANFTHVSYTLTGEVSPNGSGSVTLDSTSGYYDDVITITANAGTGYRFTGWTTTGGTIGSASTASTTITMPAANTTVTASFEKIDYNITTSADPAVGGTVTASSDTANYGDTITLSQTPSMSYAFDGYETTPEVTITNNQFTMPASNVSVVGHYHITKSTCSLDKTAYTGGDTALLTINIASMDFTHRYNLSFGPDMETEWVSVAAGVSSVSIYIPVAWCFYMSKYGTGTLSLETYNGANLLGTDTITGITYSALDNVIPTFQVTRCDESGNNDNFGLYGSYSYTKPESINTYSIRSGSEFISSPPTHGNIFPNDRKIFSTEDNHQIIFEMTYEEETITIVRDLPKTLQRKKKVVHTL